MTSIVVVHRDPQHGAAIDEAVGSLQEVRVETRRVGDPLPSIDELAAHGVDLVILAVPRASDVQRSWLARFDAAGSIDLLLLLHGATEKEILELVRLGIPYLADGACGARELAEGIRRIIQVRALARAPSGKVHPLPEVSCAIRDWLEVTAPSEARFLERFHRAARILCETKLPRRALQSLLFAISEIGLNAIEWGNEFDPEKRIRLSLCILADRILLKVEDEGRGFAHEDLPDPTADPAAHLARRKAAGRRSGGFGIWMVKGLMDEVVFSERGNAVVLQKFLDAETCAPAPRSV